MTRTKTDEELADAENHFASSDPERAELIARARRFKASWIELAEGLVEARRSQRYKDWGYDDFDSYAKKELRLRQETVDKLTGSYSFLKRRAPDVLDRDGIAREIPSYQAVDFLRRAAEREETPREVVKEIEKRIFEEAVPLPKIAREFKDTVFPLTAPERKKRDVSALKNVATRLRDLLNETHAVPKKVAVDTRIAVDALLDALGAGQEEAAA